MRKKDPRAPILPELGQKVYFDPFADMHNFYGADFLRGGVAEGVVNYINEKGHWFSVVYDGLRTSFLFSDIGKKVHYDRDYHKQSLQPL